VQDCAVRRVQDISYVIYRLYSATNQIILPIQNNPSERARCTITYSRCCTYNDPAHLGRTCPPGSGFLAKLQLLEITQQKKQILPLPNTYQVHWSRKTGGSIIPRFYVNNDTSRFVSSRRLIETQDERLSHVGDHPIPVSTRPDRPGL
jgi:hypothetical protein